MGDGSGLGEPSPDGSYKLALGARCQACGMPASHALPVMRIETADRDKVPTLRSTFCVLCYEETLEDLSESQTVAAGRSYYVFAVDVYRGCVQRFPVPFLAELQQGVRRSVPLIREAEGFILRLFLTRRHLLARCGRRRLGRRLGSFSTRTLP